MYIKLQRTYLYVAIFISHCSEGFNGHSKNLLVTSEINPYFKKSAYFGNSTTDMWAIYYRSTFHATKWCYMIFAVEIKKCTSRCANFSSLSENHSHVVTYSKACTCYYPINMNFNIACFKQKKKLIDTIFYRLLY